ncbi:hypothetical protein HMF7854_09045 [Sphingomonas ginkgonis]|uniref:Uncharacterized protein n=2 Tax=Sphingomonas ginkgonis TaxID=2315330 RepID=A0A3R9YMM5_9SPHN|nr:hypothetical protein HMF7854_09045 [Sphingomonas ginkgonis]
MADRLMRLGDEATHKLAGITREMGSGAETLARHGVALDRAAENARIDLGVLLDDLPRAEAIARAMAENLRGTGHEAGQQAAALESALSAITNRAREADHHVGSAAHRLVGTLNQIESASLGAAARVTETGEAAALIVDQLLDRTAHALDEVRHGIHVQAEAVTALTEQASAALGRAGIEAAETIGQRLQGANASLDRITRQLAEQDRASRALIADTDRAIAELDQRFAVMADQGDRRAEAVSGSLRQLRSELEHLTMQAAASDGSVEALSNRTGALRGLVDGLAVDVRDLISAALGEAEGGAQRLGTAVASAKPEIEWMRAASDEAATRLEAAERAMAAQQDRLAGLLASVDEGVGSAETRLGSLRDALSAAESEAARLQGETAPALVEAMVQVKEASAHAAERAREAIAAVIPDSAERMSDATRAALQKAVDESVASQLREIEDVAVRAVEAARTASERLTRQMLTIGQTASALEEHIERNQQAQRAGDSEAFARRVSMLIDSMNSASIDVGKILSDEVDERSWQAYLKGDRGAFTRRAARLIGGAEQRGLPQHYENDREFQAAVNRYVHDFEAMLRRVHAERDGGPIAVTLMASDMGRLYAALAPLVDRKR